MNRVPCHAYRVGACLRGFTLIELLLTIMILAIALALTFPAITGGRVQVTKVKCLNNLRQLQTACVQYAGENNGRFPVADRQFSLPHEFDNFSNTLGLYLSAPRGKIMFCPGELIKIRNASTPLYQTNYTTYQYFNFGPAFLGTFSTNKPDMTRTTTIPTDVPLWGCLASTKGGITYGHSEPGMKKPLSGMNVVYPDGHGAWMEAKNLEVYYQQDGLSLYWPKPAPRL